MRTATPDTQPANTGRRYLRFLRLCYKHSGHAIPCASRVIAIQLVACLFMNSATAEVHYNRDVLPILATKCFQCHGIDEAARQADLRLDLANEATANRDATPAIVPHDVGRSELIRRVFSDDTNEVMPPPDASHPLDDREKEVLRQWIEQGARYQQHWAFHPPRKTPVPEANWGHNEIDSFIHAALTEAKLSPQSPAEKSEWIRRVTIDLTGIPPTIEEVDAFLADESNQAYASVVDRLLADKRFGERMAMWWLDGAHYGDSHGYDNDLENSQWPWRNWVIDAFNNNKPFDEFTVEQLAGDLLANPSADQILATAFNRNHRIQTEDGAIDEEWRTEYVIDRVETMGTVWMGLTLGCCRCHDHKYDPISQREFYQLFALFNNLDEKGFINNLRGAAEPRIRYKSDQYDVEKTAVAKHSSQKKDREKAIAQLETRYPTVMVMREMTPSRKTHILKRGQYDAAGEQVSPALPTVPGIPEFNTGNAPVTRLTLARWLVDKRHPLTSRVIVNQLWQLMFGTGIVESSENFGVQSEWPSHPELLDWLAVEFIESGWDVKSLVQRIVLSATYRQSHAVDEVRLARDPKNRLLSRGPRARLQAESIRDQALFLAGLLHEQVGGPSVRPYQPAGLWEDLEKRGTYRQDHGTDLYRRSLYTAIRKTVPTPEMSIFDMPSREACTVRRSRTNTPLQALSLMNNVTHVEAARKFAERMLSQGSTTAERITWGFRAATQRKPDSRELDVLLRGYQRRMKAYRANPQQASQLVKQGEANTAEILDPEELAAMSTVASILLNLDEVLNK